jgi:deoxyribodipyrimidine photo-lyase
MSRLEQQACGCVIGRDYPAPVVDHAAQRRKALALFRAVRATG